MRGFRRLLPPFLLLTLVWAASAQAQYLTILHFNDLHGQLEPREVKGKSVGGIARIATMVATTRAWNKPHGVTTLILEAGDILQGTPLSTVFHGEPDVICLNMIGLDAMTLGNHEFDFGQYYLAVLTAKARFPIVSANVRPAGAGRALAKPFITVTIGGVPALIFGLTSPDTPIESAAKNVVGLQFLDPIPVAREIVETHRAQYPIIIALTHLGLDNDLALAKAVPGIDIIIGAHTHDALQEPMRVGKTLICQAGSRGAYLGELDAFFDDGNVARYRGFLRAVDDTVPPTPAVAQVVASYAGRLNQTIKRVIAQAPFALIGEEKRVRSQETNLGDLLADIIRDYVKADVAFVNGGGIRSGIEAGPITIESVMMVDPFGNQLATVDLTGAQLLDVLRHDAGLSRPDGGFLQVSGLSMTLKGTDASDVEVAGAPLDPNRTYKVAISEFLLSGGNGYTTFAQGKDARFVGTTLSAIVLDALQAMGTVKEPAGGRIRQPQD